DLVIGYGSDETLRDLKAKIPFGVDFVGYGHRVSFALYTQEAVTPKTLGRLARDTARDIWMMDQRGCLSPLALFLEKKGEVPPSVFAEGLALELQRLSARGAFCPPETVRCAALRSSRDRWKMRGVAGKRTLFWESRPPGEWLVLYEEGFSEPLFSKGRPVIVVRGVPSVRSVFERLKPFRKYLQAAALEANASRREKIAQALSELGVSRVCRAGALQDPPLRWHHDGRWNLAHWVRWTDVW
ncbi:MAG: hypothetical protein HYZ87_01680, partial [Candidatus Omnitrophica bacterium]|nr:hypothetical protein [Candidatus Omnitrophota bacterium]